MNAIVPIPPEASLFAVKQNQGIISSMLAARRVRRAARRQRTPSTNLRRQ
jgi:hypothetical protein